MERCAAALHRTELGGARHHEFRHKAIGCRRNPRPMPNSLLFGSHGVVGDEKPDLGGAVGCREIADEPAIITMPDGSKPKLAAASRQSAHQPRQPS